MFHVVHAVETGAHGFAVGAAVIGESYTRHADTPAQTALTIKQLITNTDSQTASEAARAAKALPFNGQILSTFTSTSLTPSCRSYLPRRGTAARADCAGG